MVKQFIVIDKVIDIFLSLSSAENFKDADVFCKTAADVVESWIDRRKVREEHSYAVCYLAACLANYRYTLKKSLEPVSIKAGDISIDAADKTAVSAAKVLYEDALQSVNHLLKLKRFAFRSIGV